MIECRNLTIVIENPLEKIPDGYSKRYIKDYVNEFINGTETKNLEYTYHDRIFKRWGNQVEKVINMISNCKQTRRMVISLWDPKDDIDNPSAPCLNYIWVAIRDDKLEFHVVFRSHHLATVTKDGNIMSGEGCFVPNIFALATLQEKMAKRLNVQRGFLVLTDMSGHLYVSDLGGKNIK